MSIDTKINIQVYKLNRTKVNNAMHITNMFNGNTFDIFTIRFETFH
jgi:hypothetical protein